MGIEVEVKVNEQNENKIEKDEEVEIAVFVGLACGIFAFVIILCICIVYKMKKIDAENTQNDKQSDIQMRMTEKENIEKVESEPEIPVMNTTNGNTDDDINELLQAEEEPDFEGVACNDDEFEVVGNDETTKGDVDIDDEEIVVMGNDETDNGHNLNYIS